MSAVNKYYTPHGWMPAWQLSDNEIEDALYMTYLEEMLYGMQFDKMRVAELEGEIAIRKSPDNVVRFLR